jgi:hypothetical protein
VEDLGQPLCHGVKILVGQIEHSNRTIAPFVASSTATVCRADALTEAVRSDV